MTVDLWTSLVRFDDGMPATIYSTNPTGWLYAGSGESYGHTNTIGFDSMAIPNGVRDENAACGVDRALEHAFTHYDDLLRRLAD